MGRETTIAWTNATLNLSWGCTKVDVDPKNGACVNCFMFRLSRQFGIDPEAIRVFDINKKEAELRSWGKEKVLVFVDDMTDIFGEFYAFDLIASWFELFKRNKDRQFQILTKRIGRAMVFFRDFWARTGQPVPDNVWIGCSIGARDRLFRLDQLRTIPARIRWVSFEPLLEDLGDFSLEGIDWAIVGGESDPKVPRPMRLEWAENVRRVCARDGVPFFFKQVGGRGGNNAGGDLLNGKRYHEFPGWRRNGRAEKH